MIKFDSAMPTRLCRGDGQTHSDYGSISIKGKDYRFAVLRWRVREDTPWAKRGTHYDVEFFRNFRRLREGCFKPQTAEIIKLFKSRIDAMNAEIDALSSL